MLYEVITSQILINSGRVRKTGHSVSCLRQCHLDHMPDNFIIIKQIYMDFHDPASLSDIQVLEAFSLLDFISCIPIGIIRFFQMLRLYDLIADLYP